MPFSSVLGANSVVKPGVCTSTTRPSVPYDGQMIYETDTNLVKVYEGAAWVTVGPTTAGGLVFISAGTFTTATSVSLPNDTFTSTYRNYRVMFNITAQTGSCAISMRLRTAGSDNTTSNYFAATPGFASANSASNQGEASQSVFNFGTTYAGAAVPSNYTFDVFNPQIAQSTAMQGIYNFFNTSGNFVSRPGSYNFDPATSFDSLTLISSVSSSITGVFRVYGYADS
jgi:hypothetical protein